MPAGWLSREPIEIDRLLAEVSSRKNGAVLTFVGQVRAHSRGRDVCSLEYDAYVPMAEKIMSQIAEDARKLWGVDVAMAHRLGRLEPGDVAVVVCVGSEHRDEAFQACRHCIDAIKANVPIWKKEMYADGAFWIEGEDAFRAE